MSPFGTERETNGATSGDAQEPYVACPVVEMAPDELPYGSYHIVSITQAIQAGRYLEGV